MPIYIDFTYHFGLNCSAAVFLLLFLLFTRLLLQSLPLLPEHRLLPLIFTHQLLPHSLEQLDNALSILSTGIFEHGTQRISIFFGLLVRNSFLVQINFVANNGHH